jgi:hypothetical protein
MSLEKPAYLINEADIQALKDNSVAEGKTIDYKRDLIGNTDEAKKEFLADVTSFANTAGGHLVIGIEEDNGVPVNIGGVSIPDLDAEKLRLENMLRDGLEPRVPGIAIQDVSLSNGNLVLIISIPKSWASPHMIKLRNSSRFYARNSAGKYQLDVTEIRSAFIQSARASEFIRDFRIDRIGKIISNEMPARIENTGKIVLHIIPLSVSDSGRVFNVASLDSILGYFHIIGEWGGSQHRNNFEGYISYGPASYLQIFRNGSLEAVSTEDLGLFDSEKFMIASEAYERTLIERTPRLLTLLKAIGVEPPLIIMLSMVGVRGYELAVKHSPGWPTSIDRPIIDRDNLVIPEVVVESFDVDSAKILKPIFDIVWNAAGLQGSKNYDGDGNWVGQK